MKRISKAIAKVKNYIDLVFSSEVERRRRKVGDDGNVYVYTLRDFECKKCVFIHVPRTAGTSICQALFGHSAAGHKTVREYTHIFGDKFASYYRFSFVRNPYTRLVSVYEYLKRGGHPAWPENQTFGDEVIGAYDSFRCFVMQWLRPGKTEWPLPHFYPQTHFLLLDDQLAVDFLGHVETIEEDFVTVCKHLDEDTDLPTMNATSGDRPPLGAYYDSDAVIQRVQEVYQSDFERLGYFKDVRRAGEAPKNE